MKASIVLNDDLVAEAMQYTQARSRKALVEEALRTFVQVKGAEGRRDRYRQRLKDLAPRLKGLHLSDSPARLLRTDRDR